MKPFNLKEYLKDPSKEVITRDGRAAKIHCTNYCSSNFPIVAEIEDWKFSELFTRDGHYEGNKQESPNDLFFASGEHREGWVNIYIGTRQMERVTVVRYMSQKMMQKLRQIFLQLLK